MVRFTILKNFKFIRYFSSNYPINYYDLYSKLRLLETKIDRLERQIDNNDYITRYIIRYNKKSKKKIANMLSELEN